MRRLIVLVMLALICFPALVWAQTPDRQHLFKIERSKNANIIQYDAQVGPDGKLFKRKPVVAYWVRLAEQGQIQKLSWIQRTFAFGFKAKLDRNRETAELDMAADFGRPIIVIREGDQYRATAPIDGSQSYLEKIFIQAHRKGISVTVEYIELFGKDMKTGQVRYQKFVP